MPSTRSNRRDPYRHPVNISSYEQASDSDRIADRVVALIGSWVFLAIILDRLPEADR